MGKVKKMSNATTDTARMAALSQIAYLNPPPWFKPERPLSDLLNYWESNPIVRMNKNYSQDAINIIRNDSYFDNMSVAGFQRCGTSGMDAFCFRTKDNEGVLAFRGTQICYKDAIVSTLAGDVLQNAAAMDFVRDMEKKGFVDMRAIGHSLGGKLAEYVTVRSDSISRSDVFNPKNFAESTVDKYQDLASGKDMNRFVSFDNGKFVGGFLLFWCLNDPNLNFGREIPINGGGQGIKDYLKAEWDNGNYRNRPDVSPPGSSSSGGGGSGMRIIVSIPLLRIKVAHFKEHLRTLERFLGNLDRAITAISRVAWVSPLSQILLGKFKLLYRTIEISLRIVEKYIVDLEEAIRLFTEAELRAKQRVGSLKTDVFGS